MVRTILEASGDTLMGKDKLGYDLLATALTMGYIDLATLLIQKGANNLPGKDGRYSNKSVHLATQQENAELVRFLLGHGVFINVMSRTDQGLTLLHIATMRREMDIARIPVKHGAQVDGPITGSGRTSLYLAAATGNLEWVQFLVEIEADPRLNAENRFCTLHTVVKEGYMDIVWFLVAEGRLDINGATDNWLTSLHMALRDGRIEMVRFLLENSANPNLKTDQDYGPLHLATQKGYKDLAQLLIQHDGFVWVEGTSGCTPFDEAVKYCSMDMVALLYEEGYFRARYEHNVMDTDRYTGP
ncbi:uncharacterized protein H6S33_008576 [Morchella sextelata]|uniref:uncharacterized protein n=1 Tax=Morchella sextelata TaxID=1174677 RepID=UPI001D03D0FD|nr:uncharacterized protein H6S33_008576 [Morchella sextelata]KAH0602495.1 hypothetical protein H6S33_008576 [Morchella sextelata]